MEGVPRIPMLGFPLKRSADVPDFKSKIKRFVGHHYNEDPEAYSQEIASLESLRSSSIHVSRDFTGCATLKKYFCQLNFLKSRFPFHEGSQIATSFSWYDVYTDSVHGWKDIDFEMACILYNIGALHSELGTKDARVNADSMKTSCTHFQCAAWAFQHLKNDYHKFFSPDLSSEILSIMNNICLAQAQECILEKSLIDNRKSAITAKVSLQIVEYYQQTLKTIDSVLKKSSPGHSEKVLKAVKKWRDLVEVKVHYYGCLSYLYRGLHSEEQSKYGERITFFKAGVDKLNEALKCAKNMDKNDSSAVTETLNFTTDVIGTKLSSSEKENEFVYHEKVPELDAVEGDFKGVSLVKGIPFKFDDAEISGPDIFARLVPIEAHEASSLYSEEKAKILRTYSGKVEEKNEALDRYLLAIQLDQLDIHNEENKIPQELVDCCAALSVNPEAVKKLASLMSKLSGMFHDVEHNLKEISDHLKTEETQEKEFQEIVGKRPPNNLLTELSREVKKYQHAHTVASESNQTLHEAMRVHVVNLQILMKPFPEVLKNIPSISDVEEKDEQAINEMRRLRSKIGEMRQQRESLTNQLRDAIMNDDITKSLVVKQDQDLQSVFDEELKKHEKITQILDQNLLAQDNILRAVTEANAAYATTRKSTEEMVKKRNQVIQALLGSYDAYNELLIKCTQGVEFYTKLDTNVTKLLQRVRSACKVQEEEREERTNSILKKSSNVSPSLPRHGQGQGQSSSPNSAAQLTNPSSMNASGSELNHPSLSYNNYDPNMSATSMSMPYGSYSSSHTHGHGPDISKKDHTSDNAALQQQYEKNLALQQQYEKNLALQQEYDKLTKLQQQIAKGSSMQYPTSNYNTTQQYPTPIASPADHSSVSAPQSTQNYHANAYPSPGSGHYGMGNSINAATSSMSSYYGHGQVSSTGLPASSATGGAGVGGQASGTPYNPDGSRNPMYPITSSPAPQNIHPQYIPNPMSMSQQASGFTGSIFSQPYMSSSTALNSSQTYVTNSSGVYPYSSHSSMGEEASGSSGNTSINMYGQISTSQQQPQMQVQPQQQQNQGPPQMQVQPQQQQPQMHVQPQQQQPQMHVQPQQQQQQPQVQPQQQQQPPSMQQSHPQQLQYSSPAVAIVNPYNQYAQGQSNNPLLQQYSQQYGTYMGQQPTSSSVADQQQQQYGSYPILQQQQPYGNISAAADMQSPAPLTAPTGYGQTATSQPYESSPYATTVPHQTPPIYGNPYLPSASADQGYNPQQQQLASSAHSAPSAGASSGVPSAWYGSNSATQNYQVNYPYTAAHNNQNQQINQNQNAGGYINTYYGNGQPSGQAPAYPDQNSYVQQQQPHPHHHQQYQSNTNPSTPSMETIYANQQKVGETSSQQSNVSQGEVSVVSNSSVALANAGHPSNLAPSSSSAPPPSKPSMSNIDLLAGVDLTLPQPTLQPFTSSILNSPGLQLDSLINSNFVSTPPVSDLNDQHNQQQQQHPPADNHLSHSLPLLKKPSVIESRKPAIVDHLSEPSALDKFTKDVENLEHTVEGFYKKSLNGPTNLDNKWKEVMDIQNAASIKMSISVARCYPMKNRYPDILPHDQTRVPLPCTKDDYINASFVRDISTCSIPYIATQAPLPVTFSDFWHMVWHHQVELIVSLASDTDLKEHTYWPLERGKDLAFGPLSISLQSKNVKPGFVERIFCITHRDLKQTRVAIHLQLKTWPGNVFPDSPGPLLQFINEVHSFFSQQRSLSRPVVVHCMAGVGKTGVFITLSAAIREIQNGKSFPDLTSCAGMASEQRKGIMNDKEYLRFAYQSLLYYCQDLLMKRGILSARATFDEKPKSTHTRHPSQDFLTEAIKKIVKNENEAESSEAQILQGDEGETENKPENEIEPSSLSLSSEGIENHESNGHSSTTSTTSSSPVNNSINNSLPSTPRHEAQKTHQSRRQEYEQIMSNARPKIYSDVPASLMDVDVSTFHSLQNQKSDSLSASAKESNSSDRDPKRNNFESRKGALTKPLEITADPLNTLDPLWTMKK